VCPSLHPDLALFDHRQCVFRRVGRSRLLPPGVLEPVLQPLRWDAEPVSQPQGIYKERGAEHAVLNIAPAGDGDGRL
jgi:hypothetical protein